MPVLPCCFGEVQSSTSDWGQRGPCLDTSVRDGFSNGPHAMSAGCHAFNHHVPETQRSKEVHLIPSARFCPSECSSVREGKGREGKGREWREGGRRGEEEGRESPKDLSHIRISALHA